MKEEEARKVIEKETLSRIEACKREINDALEKHRCRLDVSVLIKSGQVIPQLEIVPIN